MDDTVLTFKEMCAKFDVTPRTLRYYEYIELLSPRREGRNRYYASRDVARMTLILRGRRFGFSLEEMRQWLLIYDEQGNEAQMQAFVEMADRQLLALQEQTVQLDQTIQFLTDLKDETAKALK
ncbi:MAG: MerR family DNA-binding transcriptional regulator [Paracoccaceae bacterium]|nr:transcriptional regulator, merR family protein [Rhodobacteraceae bacterium HTCC2150]MDG1530221.1 MerR family DNA-binding transcriptional regulator [Paracoccaceae bacterium]